jgi:hypothetical protein
MKSNRYAIVFISGMSLGYFGQPMPRNRAYDRVTLAGSTDTTKFHFHGPCEYRAAADGFVAYSNYVFHEKSSVKYQVQF